MAKPMLLNLGGAGFITHPLLLATTSFKNYILSQQSADVMYRGTIRTMGTDMGGKGVDQTTVMEEIQESLIRRLTEAFDNVEVIAESQGQKKISITADFTDKTTGEAFSLSYAILNSHSGTRELIRYNDHGDVIEVDKIQL